MTPYAKTFHANLVVKVALIKLSLHKMQSLCTRNVLEKSLKKKKAETSCSRVCEINVIFRLGRVRAVLLHGYTRYEDIRFKVMVFWV